MKAFSSVLSSAILLLQFSTSAIAKDFVLHNLVQRGKPTFDLADAAGKQSYYDLVHKKKTGIADQIRALKAKPSSTNESELENGAGISVKLNDENYNVHINFPNKKTGGRSYGWTN